MSQKHNNLESGSRDEDHNNISNASRGRNTTNHKNSLNEYVIEKQKRHSSSYILPVTSSDSCDENLLKECGYHYLEDINRFKNILFVKAIKIRTGEEVSIIMREIWKGESVKIIETHFKNIKNHKHLSLEILHDMFLSRNKNDVYIVSELFPCKLAKLIKERSDMLSDEDFLLKNVTALISCLAELQTQGINHKELSPKNIYFRNTNMLVIGNLLKCSQIDFSKKSNKKKNKLVSNDIYISPLLRQNLIDGSLQHDEFKSSVFSLGVVFLEMCSSQNLSNIIDDDISTIDSFIKSVVSTLSFSQNYKSILLKMLQVDENVRPNFITLKK